MLLLEGRDTLGEVSPSNGLCVHVGAGSLMETCHK